MFQHGVAHYPIDSDVFNPGFSFRWPMFHNHAFACPVPPQATHKDVRTGVGGRDPSVVHIVQLTQRHTVSHNIIAFALTLRTQKCIESSAH